MTLTIMRPDGLAASGSATVTGAASAHAATSDNSDGSYVAINAPNDFVRLDLGASGMPDGAVSKSCVMRVRWSGSGTGFAGNARMSIRRPDGSVLSQWTRLVTSSTTPETIAEAPVQLTLFPEADIDAFKLQVDATSHPDLRIIELYLNYTYVLQPTLAVTAVSPDPYTATNMVPLSWVPTLDSDGGPATHYQARVFTAAQYGAGGFNPASSTATWESGIVASAVSSVVTAGLPNATLRAYVRVAQTVNGQQHWSAYSFDQFQVNVATSDVATVTFTRDDAAASNTITVTRNAATAAWLRVEVERSDDAGSIWTPVRGATIVPSTGHATVFAVTDYAAPNGGVVRYRARAYYQLSGVWIQGPWTESSPGSSWSQNRCIVRDPDSATQIEGVDWDQFWNGANLAQQYPITQGVFELLDGTVPVVVQGERQTPGRGTITLKTLNGTEAAALERLIRQPVLLVLAPATWGWGLTYVAPGVVDRQRGPKVTSVATSWPIPFTAVGAPSDPSAGVL